MKAICVDDEKLIMQDTLDMCSGLPQISEIKGFIRAADALAWVKENVVELALLDIDMPGMNGLCLAEEIKSRWPDAAIVFLTGYSQYAIDAFSIHAAGYLLKPVTKERLKEEIAYVFSERSSRTRDASKQYQNEVYINTFGNFDIYVNGEPVSFKMSKCKEILAYLIDKNGSGVSRKEIFSILWEDRLYDRKMQKQLDVYIRSLRDTLRAYGIQDVFEMEKGTLRIRPERVICDAYLFFAGDTDTVNAYRGEYMNSYSWASMTESMMYRKAMEKN